MSDLLRAREFSSAPEHGVSTVTVRSSLVADPRRGQRVAGMTAVLVFASVLPVPGLGAGKSRRLRISAPGARASVTPVTECVHADHFGSVQALTDEGGERVGDSRYRTLGEQDDG